jgi:enoyl-CoA hydratase
MITMIRSRSYIHIRKRIHRSFSSSDSKSLVKFEHDPKTKIGTLTLNSPSTYNALTVEMGREFKALVQSIDEQLNDPKSDLANLNAIIITGSNNTFSSGGDLVWLHSLRNNPAHINADKMYSFYKSFLCIRDLPVPTIAAINGYAIGAGAGLALATDIRVMSDRAKIGFNFVKLGIHAGMGGSHFLPNAMGESKAKLALLTGRTMDGVEAHACDLVHRLVESKEESSVIKEARILGQEIASMHPLAVRSLVQTTRLREDSIGGGLESALRREAYAQALCYAKTDWGEGLNAAVERRQPDFDTYHPNDWS